MLVHQDTAITDLTIDGETIDTTPWHPFYTEEQGWVDAGALQVGEHVLRVNGSYGTVEVVDTQSRSQTMYNLTVENAHTFYVGNDHWLVHNANIFCLFEAKLQKDVDYPKSIPDDLAARAEHNLKEQIRQAQNRIANEQLYHALELDPVFGDWMEQYHPEIVDYVQPLKNGMWDRGSPPGWTWHHDTWREGIMSLISKADHKLYSGQLHLPPKNMGGFEIWGVIRVTPPPSR